MIRESHTSPGSPTNPTNPIPKIPGMGFAVMGGICPTLASEDQKIMPMQIPEGILVTLFILTDHRQLVI